MKKLLAIVISSLVLGFTLLRLFAVEEAQYRVIEKENQFEIREYETSIIAEVEVDSSMEEAGNQAFRTLFKYISGENSLHSKLTDRSVISQEKAGEKIAMTTPVGQVKTEKGWLVSFMMPANYTMETIPLPIDSKVKIRQIPARKIAAISYSGNWSQEAYKIQETKLLDWITTRNLTITGTPVWARYNPPMTPSFLRRNEILIPLK
jgi:effector-binding domain-containing protein